MAESGSRLVRAGGVPEPYQPPKEEQKDPTEWRPKDNRDYERAEANVSAVSMRSEPLNYQSLADFQPGVLAGIEATARADLIRAMESRGLYPDERGIRVRWQLVVEGHGFRMPEGFVHPEAPDEIKIEGRRAWKRVVEMASDSMTKFIFAVVWRRKVLLLPEAPKVLPGKGDGTSDLDLPGEGSDPDIVDAEIVED